MSDIQRGTEFEKNLILDKICDLNYSLEENALSEVFILMTDENIFFCQSF